MAGLNLQTGLTGSVVGGMYNGSSSVAPTRTAIPEGPTTVAQAAYGSGAGPAGGGGSAGLHTIIIGGLALGLLWFMWWGLPRLGGVLCAAVMCCAWRSGWRSATGCCPGSW